MPRLTLQVNFNGWHCATGTNRQREDEIVSKASLTVLVVVST